MKIAIISDIHDNLVNLEKCLLWCRENKIEKIICCGDVTNGETLEELSKYESMFLVRGNMEIYQEEEVKKYKNINYGGRYAVFEIAGVNVGVCHEPEFINDIFNQLKSPLIRGVDAVGGRGVFAAIDIIFCGHTHKPWIEERDGVKIINPGTLGGVFSSPTFAVWDAAAGGLELKNLNEL